VSWALNLATAATVGNLYMIGIASRFSRMNGWTEAQITALGTGSTTGDAKIDAITRVVRDATANSGNVTDAVWKAAQQHGWSETQLAEALCRLASTAYQLTQRKTRGNQDSPPHHWAARLSRARARTPFWLRSSLATGVCACVVPPRVRLGSV
jgi:hypothetical protein